MSLRPLPVYQAPDSSGGSPPAGSGAGSPPPAAPPAPSRPEGLPDQFWNPETNAVKTDDLIKSYSDLSKEKADLDAKRAADPVPAKPEEYKIGIPEGLALPEGVQIKIDEKSPVVSELRAAAHEMGLGQKSVDRLLALQIKHQVEAFKQSTGEFAAMKEAEAKKLGENGAARKAAVESALKASFAEDEIGEAQLLLATEPGVRFLEKVLRKEGGGMPAGAPPRPPEPPKQTMAERWYKPQQKAS